MIRFVQMGRYLGARLLPFIGIYFFAECLEVLFLSFRESANIGFELGPLLIAVLTFLGTTLVSCLFALIPFLLYLLVLPRRWHGGNVDRWVTICLLLLFTAVNLFEEVSEVLFWDEFTSRFNFVAVDYLIYTNEVIGNIVQSYPVGSLLAGILVFSIGIVFLLRKRLGTSLPAPSWRWRGAGALCVVVFASVLNMVNFMQLSEVAGNRYLSELSKDGMYSLFNAFFSNELSYEQFYLTLPESSVLAQLESRLPSDAVRTGNPAALAYMVQPKEPEIRANVIVVLMESMGSEFFSEFRNDGQVLTPNLERLAADSLYFSHTYATGTRSVRGIEALTLARPPLPGMSLVRREDNGNLRGLGSLFQERGYETKWIYGGYGYFDNMNAFFAANAYTVVDRSVFRSEAITYANVWGVCDEDLFAQVAREADASYAAGKPFLNVILTTSNHRPFTYPEGRVSIPPKTGRRGAVLYADYAVGEFIRSVQNKPWFDNTIFVFVADHGAGSAGREELRAENHHIPLLFYAPKLISPARIDTPISQIDAVPTLLSLLHLHYTGQFPGMSPRDPNYVSRYFLSNYQKIAYVRGEDTVILSPVRMAHFYRSGQFLGKAQAEEQGQRVQAPDAALNKVLEEGISYYQHASHWREFLKK